MVRRFEYNTVLVWDDYTASLASARTGASNPTWAAFVDGIYAFQFGNTVMNQLWIAIHIKHDYAEGTPLYPHVHWSPVAGSVQTGNVRWGIEYTLQKGHQQGAFPASTTVYVDDTLAVADPLGHRVAEVSDANVIPATNVEPDTVVLIRLFRDPTAVEDTFNEAVFAYQFDLHYQKNRVGTTGKRPDFDLPDP